MFSLFTYDSAQPLLFNSGLFLMLFLGFSIFYALLQGPRHRVVRMLYVIGFSYYFYYKNAGGYVGLLAAITLVNYACGRLLGRYEGQTARRFVMWTGVVLMLATLGFFKYTNFFIRDIAPLVSLQFSPMDIFLPVGISFFVFQSITYVVDVYRRRMEPTDSLLDLAFFTSFFPTLLAGPILRAKDFLPQLRRGVVVTEEMFGTGVLYIIMGLFKKCVISDYISQNFVARIFDNPTLYSGLENLLGAYGYTLQLYCDFSGYSDIAIGIALWLGFKIPRNFDAPYKAESITDFWRRWHISLSSWLRDYLYISLGGNRCGRFRMYFNQMVTMLLGGLWHGASWNFVVWGGIHGTALCGHKWLRERLGHDKHYHSRGWKRVGATFLTFHLVCLCWIFFANSTFEGSIAMISQMFTNFHGDILPQFVEGYPMVTALMLLGYALHFMPSQWTEDMRRMIIAMPMLIQALILALTVLLVIQIKTSDIQPFIYFQF